MPALFKIICTAYWLALIAWIAALVTVGIAAMNTFGTLPDMDMQLERYADYPIVHHGRLAAGMVMERNFFFADVIQMFAIPVVLLAMVVQLVGFGMPWKRPANQARVICLCAAAALFAWYAVVLAPGMNRELRDYWQEAEAGRIEQAERHRLAFDLKHPRAEQVLKLNLLLTLVGAVASAAAFTPRSTDESRSELEEPRLTLAP